MKVLVISPKFFNLHAQIISVLERLGCDVVFAEDLTQPMNPYFTKSKLKWAKRLYYKWSNPNKAYWQGVIESGLLNHTFDHLICFDGYSFDDSILKYLKQKNPLMGSTIYLWDAYDYFDFNTIVPLFDKAFTFDKQDAQKFGINYLPLFYEQDRKQVSDAKIDNDLFFIGTAHSDRFEVLSKIYDELRESNVKYHLKLLVKFVPSRIQRVRYVLAKILNNSWARSIITEYELATRKLSAPFVVYENISWEDFNSNMARSRCVLDIEMPYQRGITHRMIGAIGMGKKIITTNKDIINTSFYDPKQMLVINRCNPQIPIEFLKNDSSISVGCQDIIDSLRIDKWIKQLL